MIHTIRSGVDGPIWKGINTIDPGVDGPMFDGALIGSNVDSFGYDSRIAATCSHLFQGKWLQVAAGSKWLQLAAFLKIKKKNASCVLNGNCI